jgi:hypothetical protein
VEFSSYTSVKPVDPNQIKKEWKKLGTRKERMAWVEAKHEVNYS